MEDSTTVLYAETEHSENPGVSLGPKFVSKY
jgi:hypothetical protein